MSGIQFKKITVRSINLWIFNNFKMILIGAGVFVLLLVAGGVYFEWQKKQENKIYGELYKLKRDLQIAGEKVNEKNYRKQDQKFSSFLNQKQTKKVLVYSEDMKSLSGKYEKHLKIYKNTKAGAVFSIDLADFFNINNEKERAISLLSEFAFPRKKSVIYHLVSFQLASYYMDDKNCEKALPIWNSLIANKKATIFHKDSYFQSALCYEEIKNYTEAKDLYKKIIENNSDNFDQQKAQEYMHLLALKQKLETQ